MRFQHALILLAVIVPLATGCAPGGTREAEGPSPAKINTDIGKIHISEGEYNQAMIKLRKALDQDPNYAPAHSTIAVLHERLREFDKAETHFKKAVRLAPDDSTVRNNFGAFLCKQKRFEEAEAQFEKAVNNPLYETPHFAYTNAGLCALRNSDPQAAETYFRAALRSDPEFPPALFQMARLSYAQQEFLQARAYLQRYMQVGRETPATLWLGVRVERELGDRDTASSYALRLKSEYPDSEETRLLLESGRNE